MSGPEDRDAHGTWLREVACRAARLGGWTIDLPARHLTWSDENCAIHDVPPGYQPTLEQGIELFPEEHRAEVRRKVEACERDGTPYEFELPKYTATGRLIWVHSFGEAVRDESGRIVRLQGAFQDITERKREQQALRESEERFRLVARATSDAIRDWDMATGTVWWSDSFRELFGDAPHGAAATLDAWQARIHPEDRLKVGDAIATAIDSGAERWEVQYRFRRHDGRDAAIHERGYVIRDAGGVARRTLAAMSDVTARLALEEQLRQSQRLDSIGQLTGGIAHDFNNLLTVVLGGAGLLAHHIAGDTEAESLTRMITDAATRGGELTQRLLAFARRQVLDPRPVNVGQLVARMQPMLCRTLGEPFVVAVGDSSAGAHALIDAPQLESALLNLALNARDALPNGGAIRVDIARQRVEGPHPDGVPAGDHVVVSVGDAGIGIPPEHLPHVFEPFFTTKPAGKGTGLGLAMVYGFVKQSGGHVTIDSRPGAGTTVTLYLPLTAPATVDEAALGAAPIGEARGHESILLVEDNDLVRLAVRRHLVDLGYRVTEAADGARALAVLEQGASVDLLFTDIMMPGMQGTELLQRARALRPSLRALLTSGFAGDALAAAGSPGPRVAFLAKPYQRSEMAAKVRAALDAD